jgi:hypothetical protein
MRFAKLDTAQRHLCVVALLLAAMAIGLLSAPVAHHRIAFRQHKKRAFFALPKKWRGRIGGSRAGAISSAFVTGVVVQGIAVPLISASVFGVLTFSVVRGAPVWALLGGHDDG